MDTYLLPAVPPYRAQFFVYFFNKKDNSPFTVEKLLSWKTFCYWDFFTLKIYFIFPKSNFLSLFFSHFSYFLSFISLLFSMWSRERDAIGMKNTKSSAWDLWENFGRIFFLSFVLSGISVGFHRPCYLSLGTVFRVLWLQYMYFVQSTDIFQISKQGRLFITTYSCQVSL